jgi:hypothetical protein
MKRLLASMPDAPVRVVAWAVVIPFALIVFAPEWLELPGQAFERLVVLLAYLAIGIAATLWSAAELRPRLAAVVEDAFGRRSDLAQAASGTTATTYAVFGLAFVLFATPGRVFEDSALETVSSSVGRALLVLGVMFLVVVGRSVARRNRREQRRRIWQEARADVGKGVSEALAARPPRYGSTPTTW